MLESRIQNHAAGPIGKLVGPDIEASVRTTAAAPVTTEIRAVDDEGTARVRVEPSGVLQDATVNIPDPRRQQAEPTAFDRRRRSDARDHGEAGRALCAAGRWGR